MIPPLRELLGRVDRLSGRLGRLGDDLRGAIENAERDSVASSIRARRVLDHIVRQIFEQQVKEPAGSRPLEQLLTRIVKDGHFPDEFAGFAYAVKGLANRVAHDVGKSYPVEFLVPTLGQLMLITEWYLDEMGGQAESNFVRPGLHHATGTGRAGRRADVSRFSRLCVYLCCTAEDLREHQQSAKQVIEKEGWLTIEPEEESRAAEPLVDALRRGMDRCDLVLLIVGQRRGLLPNLPQGADGERSMAELAIEEARKRGVSVRELLAGEEWPEQGRRSEHAAAEGELQLRETEVTLAASFNTGATSNEVGARPSLPAQGFESMVRSILRDYRDHILDEAASRPEASPSARSSRAAGAEAFLPRLELLLEGVILPRRELERAYRDSAPSGWDPLPANRNHVVLLTGCIRSLARAPRQRGDGLVPLVRFVRLIADVAGGELADRSRHWIAETLEHLALDADDAARAHEIHAVRGDEPAVEVSYHLLVQIAPRLCETGLYSVKAWLFGTGGPACLQAGEESVARVDLPSCLDALLAELPRFGAGTDRTWLELLLPRELLCSDVDQWHVGLDFIDGIPIGVEHRLIVRSLERSSRSRAVRALQERWRAVRRRVEARCRLTDAVLEDEEEGNTALWIERDDCGGMPLYASLKDAKGLVAVVLGCPPRPDPRDPSRDVLNTLFEAGVPVILWSRQPLEGGAAAVRAALTALLHGEPFHGLPDRVWDLRKRAAARTDPDEVHLGRHLSLLWDDPSRTSPDFEPKHRLQAPTTTR